MKEASAARNETHVMQNLNITGVPFIFVSDKKTSLLRPSQGRLTGDFVNVEEIKFSVFLTNGCADRSDFAMGSVVRFLFFDHFSSFMGSEGTERRLVVSDC